MKYSCALYITLYGTAAIVKTCNHQTCKRQLIVLVEYSIEETSPSNDNEKS